MKRLSDCPLERLAQCRGESLDQLPAIKNPLPMPKVVPPADDVEVIAYAYEHGGSKALPVLTTVVSRWPSADEPWNETVLVDIAHVTRLTAELTKARELIKRAAMSDGISQRSPLGRDLAEFLAHQSAPAAKDGE